MMNLTKELTELKEKATPLKTAKFIGGTLISLGTAAAVVGAFKNPIAAAKGLSKWLMKMGVFILGCKAGDIAENYFNDTVDEFVETYKENKEELMTRKKEAVET